jgi:hypothetical protein
MMLDADIVAITRAAVCRKLATCPAYSVVAR